MGSRVPAWNDTQVNYDPTAEQLAEITVMAAEEMIRLSIKLTAALLSHSNFGSSDQPSAVKMRQALSLVRARGALVGGRPRCTVTLRWMAISVHR